MEKKYCIYRHIRLDNNEVFYIGIGKNRRPYSKCSRNQHWKNIVNKSEYEVQILKSDLSLEEAKELEIILINYYGRLDLGTGILVNMTDGGDSSGFRLKTMTKEHKENLSKARIGMKFSDKHRKNISIAMKGRKLSEETCKKMSLDRIGVKRTEETKLKMSLNNKSSKKVIDISTGIIYRSITEASNEVGISYGMLKRYLSGVRNNKTTLKYLDHGKQI